MIKRNTKLYQRLDWLTILTYLLLVAIGWMNIYSACYNLEGTEALSRPMSQLIWIGTGLILGFAILLVDSKTYDTFAYPIYGLMIVLLVVTLFVAGNIKGSHSWLVIGPIRLQPAEFAKFATALALAKLVSNYDFSLKNARYWWWTLLIILLPMGIIVLQSETGSALVFLAFFLVLFREGMSGNILALGFSAAILAILSIMLGGISIGDGWGNWGMFSSLLLVLATSIGVAWTRLKEKPIWFWLLGVLGGSLMIAVGLNAMHVIKIDLSWVLLGEIGLLALYLIIVAFIQRRMSIVKWVGVMIVMTAFCFSTAYAFNNVLKDYQQNRIKVFLGMVQDPRGIGYNTEQAKIAIGSGEFFGKGFLEGTQTKLSYVPEQETDFIFCTIGEEWGFLGAVGVLALYLFLLLRIINMAERQSEIFSRVYGYSVACIIFFHIVVNVGMVIGFMPVIGIPLPLISYGGSSLWAFTILLFIFLKLDASRAEQLR